MGGRNNEKRMECRLLVLSIHFVNSFFDVDFNERISFILVTTSRGLLNTLQEVHVLTSKFKAFSCAWSKKKKKNHCCTLCFLFSLYKSFAFY